MIMKGIPYGNSLDLDIHPLSFGFKSGDYFEDCPLDSNLKKRESSVVLIRTMSIYQS